MKTFLKSAIWVSMGLFLASGAMADSGAGYEQLSQPEESVSTDDTLNQFGQPETVALSRTSVPQTDVVSAQPNFFQRVFSGISRPSVSTEDSSHASARTDYSTNYSLDFPKVQTQEDEKFARKFDWWPTDAQPGPVKDTERSGYWWWPEVPGEARPWGNQGYIYVRKIIFDYKSTDGLMKPSLIIKKILKNVKVYFDYDKADIREDVSRVLDEALSMLAKNPEADVLITGNCDTRGSEQYNLKLGERRAESVRVYLSERGLSDARIRILSEGKLNALAPKNDIVGMQKDRNAQFMIAEVEEVMIPADKAEFFGENQEKIIEEKEELESEVRVDVKEYTIQKGDTLWAIAEREYGNGMQWKRLYEFNKDVISNPDRPRRGTKIRIPIE